MRASILCHWFDSHAYTILFTKYGRAWEFIVSNSGPTSLLFRSTTTAIHHPVIISHERPRAHRNNTTHKTTGSVTGRDGGGRHERKRERMDVEINGNGWQGAAGVVSCSRDEGVRTKRKRIFVVVVGVVSVPD